MEEGRKYGKGESKEGKKVSKQTNKQTNNLYRAELASNDSVSRLLMLLICQCHRA